MTKTTEKKLWRLHKMATESERLKGLLETGVAAQICEDARGAYSTRKFGARLGVTGQYINGIERGRFVPSVTFFRKLVEYCLKRAS